MKSKPALIWWAFALVVISVGIYFYGKPTEPNLGLCPFCHQHNN